MKKYNVILVILIAFLFAVAGCQNTSNDAGDSKTQKLTATIELIDVDDKSVATKTVEFDKGQTLMEIIKENFKYTEDGGFLTSIESLTPDTKAQQFISISVNGELAMKGANELTINDGDQVTFSIEVWE